MGCFREGIWGSLAAIAGLRGVEPPLRVVTGMRKEGVVRKRKIEEVS